MRRARAGDGRGARRAHRCRLRGADARRARAADRGPPGRRAGRVARGGGGGDAAVGASSAAAPSLVLGILGGGDRRGRWRVPERMTVVNALGRADLDLREATLAAPEVEWVFSLLGGSDVIVPEGRRARGLRPPGRQRPEGAGPAPPPAPPSCACGRGRCWVGPMSRRRPRGAAATASGAAGAADCTALHGEEPGVAGESAWDGVLAQRRRRARTRPGRRAPVRGPRTVARAGPASAIRWDRAGRVALLLVLLMLGLYVGPARSYVAARSRRPRRAAARSASCAARTPACAHAARRCAGPGRRARGAPARHGPPGREALRDRAPAQGPRRRVPRGRGAGGLACGRWRSTSRSSSGGPASTASPWRPPSSASPSSG